MIALIEGVIANDGPEAVHGLFSRGGRAPYLIEVLNRDEEAEADLQRKKPRFHR